MLEERHFIIFTDHKSITYAILQKRTNAHRNSSII
jgi:hypothetical protein